MVSHPPLLPPANVALLLVLIMATVVQGPARMRMGGMDGEEEEEDGWSTGSETICQ